MGKGSIKVYVHGILQKQRYSTYDAAAAFCELARKQGKRVEIVEAAEKPVPAAVMQSHAPIILIPTDAQYRYNRLQTFVKYAIQELTGT